MRTQGGRLTKSSSFCGSKMVLTKSAALALCIPLIAFAAQNQASSPVVYEIAINNGRVIDPETKLDAQRNIGIRNGKIATITGEKITAQCTINARGKIVAPGFIDTHVHAPDLPLNQRMLARDGVTTALDLENGAHPRTTGAHARVLRLNREENLMSWPELLAKLSLYQARFLEENGVPQMRYKGRIQQGMDADITIFDPETVRDNATLETPARPSAGIPYVLVNGQVVVENSAVLKTAKPGVGIKHYNERSLP